MFFYQIFECIDLPFFLINCFAGFGTRNSQILMKNRLLVGSWSNGLSSFRHISKLAHVKNAHLAGLNRLNVQPMDLYQVSHRCFLQKNTDQK